MTKIREKVVADTDVSEEGNGIATVNRIVLFLAISAIALTGMNILAGIYLSRASGELHSIESKLEKLAAFEKNIVEQISSTGKKMDVRVGNLGDDIRAELAELSARLEKAEKAISAFDTGRMAETAFGSITPDAQEPVIIPAPDGNAEPTASVASNPAPAKAPEKKRRTSSSYQRIESADGKVYYKKVR